MKRLIFLLIFIPLFVSSQVDSIEIILNFDPQNKSKINVVQYFDIENRSENSEIYLHQWINAYKDKNSVLAKSKLAERKDQLYFVKKEKRGWIENLKFQVPEQTEISYNEINPELIKLNYSDLEAKRYNFFAEYTLHIPSQDFTGYGKANNDDLFLKYFFLQAAIFEKGKLVNQHFRDFESLGANPTYYKVQINQPKNYKIYTDLKYLGNRLYEGKDREFFEIAIQKNKADKILTPKAEVLFGFELNDEQSFLTPTVLDKQLRYLSEYLGDLSEPIIISQKSWRKKKLQGLDDLEVPILGKIRIFKPLDKISLILLSPLFAEYTARTINVDMEKNHWIRNGIAKYLELKYIEDNYPDLYVLGNLPDDISIVGLKPLKLFEITKIKFNERASWMYRYFLQHNLDQSISTPYNKLSNMNQNIVSGYKTAFAFQYLKSYLEEGEFDSVLKSFIAKYRGKRFNDKDLANYFNKKVGEDLSWFFNELIKTEKKFDFGFKRINTEEDSIKITIKNKSKIDIPFKISGYKNDEKVFEKWYKTNKKKTEINIANLGQDRFEINENTKFPDSNPENNTRTPQRIFNKKLKISLFTDIPSDKYFQLFLNPEFSWNNYDKLQLGLKVSNQSLLPTNLEYNIKPFFSFGESTVTGQGGLSYTFYPDKGLFRSIKIGGGSAYRHYNKGLKYFKYSAGLSLFFRKEARSLRSRAIGTSFEQIFREVSSTASPKEIELIDYNLYNLSYSFWHPDIINERSVSINFQHSNKFTKVYGEIYFRHKFSVNKRLGLRFFGGIFLTHKLNENDYFDFGLDHISDYMFRYALLGRSETQGILSQQFVLAEGGFKSNFFEKANQYLFALNIEYPIWKVIDLYADFAIFKSKLKPIKTAYDTGVRVKIIPDFLELYFPVQSSLGFEPKLPKYYERIRFMLHLDLGKVISYWSRGKY